MICDDKCKGVTQHILLLMLTLTPTIEFGLVGRVISVISGALTCISLHKFNPFHQMFCRSVTYNFAYMIYATYFTSAVDILVFCS